MTGNTNVKESIGSRVTCGIMAAGALAFIGSSGALAAGEGDPAAIDLIGTVRDFRERTVQDGHPDFERVPFGGFGQYCANIAPSLSDDRKPIFTGAGFKISNQWRDSNGRPICYLLFDAGRGDTEGSFGRASTGGILSAESFETWFHDEPGLNLSKSLGLTLHLGPGNTYVFDDSLDTMYEELGGFFPLEDQLFGNPGGRPDRNFHFTFELHTDFVYDGTTEQTFRFVGDDDVWVYIDGNLVIDLGGVHTATEQYVDLSRLGLVDGETYTLDFFFAERHRTQSNFRIETTLVLRNTDVPSISAAYD